MVFNENLFYYRNQKIINRVEMKCLVCRSKLICDNNILIKLDKTECRNKNVKYHL